MALLYADEDIPHSLVLRLRALGHDVVSVSELGRKGRSDTQVLQDAAADGRIVVTHNRRDFERLHQLNPGHPGILSATRDPDEDALGARIDAAITANTNMVGRHVRVNRPP
jgi:predicted nuclease of predicted toxin-antitoxin system